MWPRLRPLALGLIAACQTPQAADTSQFTSGAPMTSGPASSDSAGTSSSGGTTGEASAGSTSELSAASSSGDASSGGTTLILDVGTDKDLGDGNPAGCQGKIDFLFVISRAPGMSYFQEQLLAALPKFIDTIEARFADFDYHIMVVDGDASWGSAGCAEDCPVQCEPNYPCDYVPTYCDTILGAGTVYPAGYDAANKPCEIDGGFRYMTKGHPNLKETFACVAQVGSSGSDLMGEALTAVMQSNINDPGGCNPGFLRKDALLMVTMISNTYDQKDPPWGSKGTPETWTEAVREAKGDDLASVVMFSILEASPQCHPKDRTCQMVKVFPYSLLANREENYGPRFDEATDLIEKACAGFVPPG